MRFLGVFGENMRSSDSLNCLGEIPPTWQFEGSGLTQAAAGLLTGFHAKDQVGLKHGGAEVLVRRSTLNRNPTICTTGIANRLLFVVCCLLFSRY